jgi:hypothetical protein
MQHLLLRTQHGVLPPTAAYFGSACALVAHRPLLGVHQQLVRHALARAAAQRLEHSVARVTVELSGLVRRHRTRCVSLALDAVRVPAAAPRRCVQCRTASCIKSVRGVAPALVTQPAIERCVLRSSSSCVRRPVLLDALGVQLGRRAAVDLVAAAALEVHHVQIERLAIARERRKLDLLQPALKRRDHADPHEQRAWLEGYTMWPDSAVD